MPYRIRIEKTERIPQTEADWKTNAKEGGLSDYVFPPEGATKVVTETIYDQVVNVLDVAELVCHINKPATSTGA